MCFTVGPNKLKDATVWGAIFHRGPWAAALKTLALIWHCLRCCDNCTTQNCTSCRLYELSFWEEKGMVSKCALKEVVNGFKMLHQINGVQECVCV